MLFGVQLVSKHDSISLFARLFVSTSIFNWFFNTKPARVWDFICFNDTFSLARARIKSSNMSLELDTIFA